MSLEKSQSIAIDIERLTKTYSGFCALDDVSLNIRSGEFISLLGSSGSGKTTLLMALAGFVQPDSGSIRFGGREMVFEPPHKRDVGMMFQNYALFPHMTVLENLMVGPRLVSKLSELQARELAHEYLDRVRIGNQADKYPSQLSGGQQQRVAIARALCMRPRIMLFDEPTSALDPEMVKEVLDVMGELAQDGITMVCVTHEMGFARRVADRIIFMDQGCIIEQAKPTEFFDNPQHERAREVLSQILSH